MTEQAAADDPASRTPRPGGRLRAVLSRIQEFGRAEHRPRSPRGPLVEGMLGSLLVLLGSFGVGWLVSISAAARLDWVILLRTEPAGVITSTTALTLGCWVMFRAWLRLGRALEGFGGRSLRTVTCAAALWSLPQLVSAPIFSRDVFAYLGQGRLVLAGRDPYETGVSSVANWFQLGTDILWAESETPYGPIFLWLEAGVMRLTGDDVDLAILLFRAACVLGVALIMVCVPPLARMHGVDPGRAQWITVANPLLIVSFISSAHNDALMVGLALAGIWAAARGRGVVATLLVVLSIGIKPITMVLLPFIGLLWAGPGASWPRRLGYWAMTAALAAAVLVAVGFVQGSGFGWVSVLAGTGTGSVFWSPIGILDTALSTLLDSLGLTSYWTLDTLKLLGRLLSVAIVIVLMVRGSEQHIVQRMMWALTALVVLSPIIQPWYLLWLLPLFAVTGIRGDWQFKWVVFTVAFFLAFGAMDQLSIWNFLQMDGQMAALSLTISWACIAWMALVDRGTRWVLFQGWRGGGPAARHAAETAETTARRPGQTGQSGRQERPESSGDAHA